MAAAYSDDIGRVTQDYAGIPVNIVLHERTDIDPVPFYCLSWRTLLPSARINRRLYRLRDDGCWTIPFSVALVLLESANDAEMLVEDYDDPQIRHGGTANLIMDSRNLGNKERDDLLNSILGDVGEPEWGDASTFVVIEVPDKRWRKIMIVDSKRDLCTFRSTTVDGSYTFAESLPRTEWRLDRSMQDASAEMMRVFLSVLREL